ncbi:hypothetical protein HDU98_010935 [Podochytrium sp. JEL0797]|nr:hypothetical protein HDU98_010935 [Podochytrium sp. JEL0797]
MRLATSLERLHLPKNRLEGEIPASITSLSNLTLLHSSDNRLSGPVPVDKLEDDELPHTSSQLQNTFTFVPVSTAESQYLQSTIGKILVGGVTHVLASQCDDPVDALGRFLLSYDENKRAFEAEEASRMAAKLKAIPQSVQMAEQAAKQEFQEEVASWNPAPVDLTSIFRAPPRVPSTNNLSSTSSSTSLADESNPPSESTDAAAAAGPDAPDALQVDQVDSHVEVAPSLGSGEVEEVSIKELEQGAVVMGDEEETGRTEE